ncbi:hypothetical protein LAC81_26910 [Ensifer adhaerens]|uniref:hypothetical protein n=1 Tax=Ensifer adhaerens TaxID=106592 RepID=UPI001CBE26E2|nr:hypothetical protein [Ensifer adhaerens]MBZ7924361.1 hypothetical protein [Ensifer adhaerens]UAX96390.1 hypothetical protein LAC78_21575 [Ensifer adhaerens]UAY04267.1 hypothetical protein LAC80_23385 [Ensifer adhaerens]UAY12253.1 hypothetical protein LAC81_26910 [Ensifer adhaerens]
MSWQVNYALDFLPKAYAGITAEPLGGDIIKLTVMHQPDVVAAISGAREIDATIAELYLQQSPQIDFLCGYRKECVWHGASIQFLEERGIGWGTPGTLATASQAGKARGAPHKDFRFSHRLLLQTKSVVKGIQRHYDRLYDITVKSGRTLRVGLLLEYEPIADSVRSFWDRFGAVDVFWNINPNGSPTLEAISAAKDLGCEVLKWDDFKEYMGKA